MVSPVIPQGCGCWGLNGAGLVPGGRWAASEVNRRGEAASSASGACTGLQETNRGLSLCPLSASSVNLSKQTFAPH